MAPHPIRSAEDFRHAVKIGETTEGLHLDFKQVVNWKQGGDEKAAQATEVCRDIAQFANTEGGTLLIGVIEKSNQHGLKVATGVLPVDAPNDFKKWIVDAITNHMVPNTFPHSIDPIALPEGVIFAVNVPASLHLVAIWDRHRKKNGIEFLRRNSFGKDWMNPDDVERHIMNGSRAAMLKMKAMIDAPEAKKLRLSITPPPGQWKPDPDAEEPGWFTFVRDSQMAAQLVSAEVDVLTIRVAGNELAIPYAFLEAAWFTAERRPALALTHQIVVSHSGVPTLESLDNFRRR